MLSLPKFFADTHLFFFSLKVNGEVAKIKDWKTSLILPLLDAYGK